jgi:guanylate kinase
MVRPTASWNGPTCTATATAPPRRIEERIAQGADVILEIDFQGALQIKQDLRQRGADLHPAAQLGRAALAAGAARRGQRPVIELRLKNAAEEMARRGNSTSL